MKSSCHNIIVRSEEGDDSRGAGRGGRARGRRGGRGGKGGGRGKNKASKEKSSKSKSTDISISLHNTEIIGGIR